MSSNIHTCPHCEGVYPYPAEEHHSPSQCRAEVRRKLAEKKAQAEKLEAFANTEAK